MSVGSQQDLKVSGDIGLQGCNYGYENREQRMLDAVARIKMVFGKFHMQ